MASLMRKKKQGERRQERQERHDDWWFIFTEYHNIDVTGMHFQGNLLNYRTCY